MNHSIKKFQALLIASAVMVTACSKPVSIPEGFFDNNSASIAVLWSANSEFGQFARTGNQGILDEVINETVGDAISKGFIDQIKSVKIKPIIDDEYLEKYGKTLTEKSFDASLVRLPVDVAELREKKKVKGKSRYNFSSYKDTYGVDYVMWLDVRFFGLQRNYYGFIPTGAPFGISVIHIQLVDTSDNTIIGEFRTSKSKKAGKKWKNAPEFAELMDAATETLVESIETAYFGFFDQ